MKINKLITPTKFKNYYIEVCPITNEFKSIWGPEGVFYNCQSETDGYKNTVQMYLHGNELAEKVLNLNIKGKDDWYIPAIDELNHVQQSKILHAGDINSNSTIGYWSSTEENQNRSHMQYVLDDNDTATMLKSRPRLVRPIRRVYSL